MVFGTPDKVIDHIIEQKVDSDETEGHLFINKNVLLNKSVVMHICILVRMQVILCEFILHSTCKQNFYWILTYIYVCVQFF